MHELTNGFQSETEHIQSVLDQLRQRKEETEVRIAATEALLALYGADSPEPAPNNAMLGSPKPANLHGLSIKEAVIAYARSLPDGVYRCKDAAREFVEQGIQGYTSTESAQASMYHHLMKDQRFTKIAPGTFRFKEAPGVGDLLRAKALIQNREAGIVFRGKAPMAVTGRDHSLAPIPPRLQGFDFGSIRGMHYLAMAIAVARYVGGTVSSRELTAAAWRADMGTDKFDIPHKLGTSVWGALNNKRGRMYFKQLDRGEYQLLPGVA